MDLIETLRNIMAEQFDIHTDEQLINAVDNLDMSSFSIFVKKEELISHE